MFDTVTVEKEQSVGIVRMNRPRALNALNPALVRDLVGAFKWLRAQDDIRVGILTGEGRAFCAGGDLKEMESTLVEKNKPRSSNRHRVDEGVQQLAREIVGAEIPVIAAVNGWALGGGLEIALDCDFRIAADNAGFGFPENSLGLFVTGGVTSILPKIVGLGWARRLLFTAERIDAQTALRIGLVDEVVPAAELMKQCREMAEKILSNGPVSVSLTKNIVNKINLSDLEAALAMETEAVLTTGGTEDHIEGPRSFLERRKPRFVGR